MQTEHQPGAGQGRVLDALATLGARIRRDAWTLAARWLDNALADESLEVLATLPPVERYASMPAVLAAVGDAIGARVSQEKISDSLMDVARLHGAQRREAGFSQEQWMREVLLLRDLLWEELSAHIELDLRSYDELRRRLDWVFDQLMMHTGHGYVETVVKEMEGIAATDGLTELFNRRGFEEGLKDELIRSRRYDRPLSVAYLDVEGLKRVNDQHGHQAGDRLLRTVANLIEQESRDQDLCGRIGGDEFAVALIEQDEAGAHHFCRRIAERLHNIKVMLGHTTNWGLTIGVATFPADGHTAEDLLGAADRRLYAQRGIEIRDRRPRLPTGLRGADGSELL